jgi:two-component system, sensor histidine kinase and response regulator
MAKIRVTDTGIGMDAAAIGKIFEPFSQADETTTRKFGGTGLGLAICRELADLMQARITVDSKPQIGSTFCLALPLTVGEAAPAAASSALPARQLRILTRRVSLEESLSRHVKAMGMSVAADTASGAASGVDAIVLLDATTHRDELKALLAAPEASRPALVVIATAAEVESLHLRVQLPEKAIVLKPVHRIALGEALAVAAGVEGASSASPAASCANGAQLRGHVLLVEDEAVNAAVAEGYLNALGCTSVWVKNGNDAISRSGAERFDLILMDLNMPGMDGFAAARLIREREAGGPRVPIVALTAHDAVNFRARVLEAEMDDILSKPYALEDCTKLLRRWLKPAPESQAAIIGEGALPATPATDRASAVTLHSVDASAVNALRKMRGGAHADLYSKLVALFQTSSVESLAQLRAALDANDLRAAATACHKLAASAGNVGALAYARQVRELEHICNAGDAARANELCRTLQSAHAPLIDALVGYTMRATA